MVLHRGPLKCIVDSLFYPSKPRYVSEVWFASEAEKILGWGDFITTIVEKFGHLHCRDLQNSIISNSN